MATKRVQAVEEPLFVGINNPEGVQKNTLEAVKDLLIVLKQIERVTTIRKQKIKKVEEVNKLYRQLKALLEKLKKKLPISVVAPKKTREEKKKKAKTTKKEEAPKKEVIIKKPLTELEKLEDEISMIEKRLSSL